MEASALRSAGLARRPWVALLPIAVGLALSFGLLSVRFEDRVNKLWVEQGGRLDSELDYVEQNNGTAPGTAAKDQVLLTVAPAGVLNEGVLNEHLLLLRRIYSRISVTLEAPLNHPKCAHLSDAVCHAHLGRCEDVAVHLTMPPGLLVLGGHL